MDGRYTGSEGKVKHLLGGAVFLFLCAGGTRVEAQGVASSFDQLSVLVKSGDTITVVDGTGTEAKGRIWKLSRDTLTLVTSAGPRQFDEVDVATISQRRGDSLKNGAIIGAVAGIAYFVTGAVLLRDSDGGGVIIPAAIAAGVCFAGMGAAAGVGIDALISRRHVIYQKPAGGSRVTVSPVLGHGRRGAALTVKF